MNPIDNSSLVGMCNNNCSVAGFTPRLTFTYDGTNVVLQDGSTFPSGDGLKKAFFTVHDKYGKSKQSVVLLTGSGHAITLDVSALNANKGLDITATVITNNNIVADGNAPMIGAAGAVSNWNQRLNAQ